VVAGVAAGGGDALPDSRPHPAQAAVRAQASSVQAGRLRLAPRRSRPLPPRYPTRSVV